MELMKSLPVVCICVFFICASSSSAQESHTEDLPARIEALEKRATQCDEKIADEGRELNGKLAEQNLAHAKQIAKQESIISELRSLVTEQCNKVKLLENDVEKQKQLIDQLVFSRTNNVGFERETAEPGDVVVDDNDTEKDKRSSPRENGLNTGIRPQRLVVQNEGPVAFQALVNVVGETHLSQKIVFDTVLLNLGGGFHGQHGLFIAPTAGIYIFSTSITSGLKPHNHIRVGILKNGVVFGNAYAYGDTQDSQGAVTVVTQLALGDEVWIKIHGPADTSLRGSSYTSFMGCLVMYT